MSIPLFWWSFKQFYNTSPENYGDLLSKYLVEHISGEETHWINPNKTKWYHLKKENYLVIGSILTYANKHSVVWGSGIIERTSNFGAAKFLAVRGPETRKRVLELGYECPEVYGDPGILLPLFYNPSIDKKYKVGIIPHYVDYELVSNWYKDDEHIKVINFRTNSVEKTTDEILSCERIVSSSLHGVIVSQAYNIPTVWVQFSDKLYGDNVKFEDYFKSVGIPPYQANFISEKISESDLLVHNERQRNLPDEGRVEHLQTCLMDICPFNRKHYDNQNQKSTQKK